MVLSWLHMAFEEITESDCIEHLWGLLKVRACLSWEVFQMKNCIGHLTLHIRKQKLSYNKLGNRLKESAMDQQ